jgi:STE24 endopeptidase
MQAFTTLFLLALVLSTGVKLWLNRRHARYVHSHRGAVPREFEGRVPIDAHRKAADYTCAKARLGVWNMVLDGVVLLGFTLGGGLQALDRLWTAWIGDGLLHGVALIASVAAIAGILELPLSLYRVFAVEARFGFNKMTLALFCSDLLKQVALSCVLGGLVVSATLWMMDRLGPLWWLYAWVAWMALNLVIMAVYPTWIAPLFNKFTPLSNPELKARIEALLHKCGFRAQGLFVMDGSKRSSHGNAYFTGFGKSKRIVFFDTLLKSLEGAEIEAVLAHELGHFKRRHVLKRILLTFVLSFLFLWLLGFLMRQPWFYSGLGVATPSTAMALILFFLVLPVFTFLLQPIGSFYSRLQEFEADRYAAQNAQASDLVSALVKLYQDNASTLTPDPLHSKFYDSHPPAAARIERLQSLAAA